MAAVLMPEGRQSFEDSAGLPLVGGKLYTYQAGTSTPQTTYKDAAGVTPNTNPIILDARGECQVFWSGSYKITLTDAADVVIWTQDNVQSADVPLSTLRAELASGATAATGAGMIGFGPALTYAANTVGFELALRKRVIATGSAVSDTAALNAAIVAATDYTTIELFGDFAINATVTLKPMLRLVHARGTITFSGTGRMFDYSPGTPTGYPGRIVLEGFRVNGPGAGGAAEWLHIDANCPFVLVRNCFITSFAKIAYMRDAYCSTFIDCSFAVMQHGVQLYRESHAFSLFNCFIDSATVAALSTNYGGGAGTGVIHNLNVIGGAYQNSATGIWLEQSQGAHISNVYHEGNTGYDIRIGIADAGAYMRAAYGTIVDGYETASPCAAGQNIRLEHAVGTDLRGISWNAGASTTATLCSYDGFSDRTILGMFRYTTTTPTSTAPVNFTIDPTRGRVDYGAELLFGVGTVNALSFGDLSNRRLRLHHSQPSSRNTGNITSLLDMVQTIGDAGVWYVRNTTGTNMFIVDPLNNKVNVNLPLDMASQITATTVGAAGGAAALPATPVGYLQVVINGTARKIPYYAV